MLTKLIALLCLMSLQFASWIAIMILGWGLQPSSWGWIIGGCVVSVAAQVCANFIKDQTNG